MSEPTKVEETDNGDMMTALTKMRDEEPKEPKAEEPKEPEEKKDEPTKDESEDETDEDLDLSAPKEGEDLAVWREQKEKGVQKLVERYKRKESELDTRTKEFESKSADAEIYLKNKETIDSAIAWMQRASHPDTHDEAIAQLSARVKGEKFEYEHDSDAKLATHLEKQMADKITALEAKLEAATKPLLSEREAKEREVALRRKADDTFDETALKIASTCKGFVLDKAKFTDAVVANPDMEPVDAVQKHLFNELLSHAADTSVRGAGKKREMIDSSTAKGAQAPDSSDMNEHLAYLRASGAL